jgi:hypothetical protein
MTISRRMFLTGTATAAAATALALPALSAAAAATALPAAQRNDIKLMVVEEALAADVPVDLALAVAKVQSDFLPRALGPRGARGVMQIAPEAARADYGVSADELWDPQINIQIGIDRLASLRDRYGNEWRLVLSHFERGPLETEHGAPAVHPGSETFIAQVALWRERYREQAAVWSRNGRGWRRTADLDNEPGLRRTPSRAAVRRTRETGPERVRVRTARHLEDDMIGPSFRERLARARSSLDDFASNARWWD